MSGPHNITLGPGVTQVPVIPSDAEQVRRRGFDPEHVELRTEVFDIPDLMGTAMNFESYDLLVPKDAEGVRQLTKAGYREVPGHGYLPRAQHAHLMTVLFVTGSPDSFLEASIRDAFSGVSAVPVPDSRATRPNVSAAIVTIPLMITRPDPKYPGQTRTTTFEARAIDPNVSTSVQRDAEAVLSNEGLVSGLAIGSDGVMSEYWMTEVQWAAYDRLYEASRGAQIDQ